jgi:RNA polymerase sigma-70 factor (ECF subfamily)
MNMSNHTDEENGKVIEQHKTVLATLFEEYYDKIAHYAYLRIGDRSEAEDIAGEVFLKALKSLKSYNDRGIPMQAWLFKIAHNLVVDHLKKVARRRLVHMDTVEIDNGISPTHLVEKEVEMQTVTEAMEELTQGQREVIGLRFFGDLSSKEIGSILNKSDGAVREMQRAAIEKLRKVVAKQHALR